MAGFDPQKFASLMDDYIEIAEQNLELEYQRELNAMRGISADKLNEFGGDTSQMEEIIKELEEAKEKNLKQAELINNLKKLGETTYGLAKKISALIP